MTIKHIRIFLAVYQEMNITRAAERLHMTQPAVSRSIQELESYYGVRLFERIHHKLFRTDCGNNLYAYALHIQESFASLEKGLKNWDEFGLLRIGSTITIGNFVMPYIISKFQKTHPNIQLKVTISNSSRIQQGLLDNQLDIALIEGSVSSDCLFTKLLTTDRLCLILSHDHPLCTAEKITLDELIHYPLLLRENGSAGRSFLNHVFDIHGLTVNPMWESASTQALVKAVAAGIGISILPEQLVKQDLQSGVVVTRPVADEKFLRKNYLVRHKQKYISPTAAEFIELCHVSANTAEKQ